MLNCISNLAWQKKEEKKALRILKKNNIKLLEFAPNLLLNNKFDITSNINKVDFKKQNSLNQSILSLLNKI